MSITSKLYTQYQNDNPEKDFNDNLIYWREKDNVSECLKDVFSALEVIPGITFNGIEIETDESKFPANLSYNDIEISRLDLAKIYFTIELQGNREDITLNIFLPKLIDRLFYQLNGNLYYPILQLVDRGTYITKKMFTLKTLLMPLVFRRDTFLTSTDIYGNEYTDMTYILDLFKNKINIFKYFFANRGITETFTYFDVNEKIFLASKDDLKDVDLENYRTHEIKGTTGICILAEYQWLNENPHYHGALFASLLDALTGTQRKIIEEDNIVQWRKKLGKYFTQNSNGFEEKADKILISLERILDQRTKKNLVHVKASDKDDVYAILRWMMREYKTLIMIDGMDVRNKRIRVAEYLIHPLLLKFSENTYRLLNSKNLTFKNVIGIFNPFIYNENNVKSRPQINFLIKKLVTNELLRYVNLVNSFDLLIALRWTNRGPQSLTDRGKKTDISLKYRGHHPSYVGRIGLSAASTGDPGTSGTLVPFVKTKDSFFL
jgi:hypothetical protein